MAGVLRNLAAYTLIGTTTQDGGSVLPRGLQRMLSMIAGEAMENEDLQNSLKANLVREAVAFYRAMAKGRSYGDVPAVWQESPGGTMAVQVLPKVESDAQRQELRQLGNMIQQVSMNHPRLAPIMETAYREGYPYLLARLGEKYRSLAQQQGSPMDAQRAIRTVLQVADALKYAHYRGLIHGALAPADIYLNEDNAPSVLGVGLDQLRRRLGIEGTLPRTPLTPPEVAAGGQPDVRTDVYALGALLCFLLTAKVPVAGQPVRISDDNSAVAPTVDAVLTRALAVDPADRYQTVAQFSRDLLVASRAPLEPKKLRPESPHPAQPARPAPQPEAAPGGPSLAFPDPLPMPAVDTTALDQPLYMPEKLPMEAIAIPAPPPIPHVDWEAMLRPVDVSQYADPAASQAYQLPAASTVDPLVAAVVAVQKHEAARSSTPAPAPRPSQPPATGRRRRVPQK